MQDNTQSIYPNLNQIAASLDALSAVFNVTLIDNVSQSLNQVFVTMNARLGSIVSATDDIPHTFSAVHQTMANTLQSTQRLLDTIPANITTTVSNDTTADRFSRTALDVKTLMYSLASVRIENATSPLYVLSNSLAVVHQVSRTCAQLLGHPQLCAEAIGEAARAVQVLHDGSLQNVPPTQSLDDLYGIIATYSKSVHAITAPLARINIKGRVVMGPGPELKLREPVYGDLWKSNVTVTLIVDIE